MDMDWNDGFLQWATGTHGWCRFRHIIFALKVKWIWIEMMTFCNELYFLMAYGSFGPFEMEGLWRHFSNVLKFEMVTYKIRHMKCSSCRLWYEKFVTISRLNLRWIHVRIYILGLLKAWMNNIESWHEIWGCSK